VAQQATATANDYTSALATIEKSLEEKRKEFGIPGMSLAIVKDDKVVYLKGLGVKDFEKNIPVTPDTRFAIGSSTKAFTAMLAVMSADEGKLSLDDSPKKFLPYFTLRDEEAAAKITMRDLLAHRSGLNRTDLAMVTGVLNREELIRVAGMAKPTAKLGEKWQYQNIMYAAAGEAVAKAQNSTWDALIAKRIFKPLGMTNSDTSPDDMQKSRDYSFGYDYNSTTKVTRRLPQRPIPAAAPAGAINSSARDMAQWVRLMLGDGVFNGQRLVSEKGFAELTRKQINIAGTVDYGLGWFLRQWNGHKIVEHGGNIDGFNAQVAFMPDQKLGFVLLTNVTASPIGAIAMNTIWQALVGTPAATAVKYGDPVSDPKKEVGKYLLPAGVSFDVSWKDDKLVLTVPGQPPYPLENVSSRRY
jgi:CubicO group peptidase (beta-lactamase class C family)